MCVTVASECLVWTSVSYDQVLQKGNILPPVLYETILLAQTQLKLEWCLFGTERVLMLQYQASTMLLAGLIKRAKKWYALSIKKNLNIREHYQEYL